MFVVVTGKTGSGKTTFAKLLAQKLNYCFVDLDKMFHNILLKQKVKNFVVFLFGKEVLNDEQNIDTKKIGNIIFLKKFSFKKTIYLWYTWHLIKNELNHLIFKNKNLILDWYFISKTKYFKKSNYKILIVAPDILRTNNVIKRDKISKEYFEKRESYGIAYDEKKFDFVFENNFNEINLISAVEKVAQTIKIRFNK